VSGEFDQPGPEEFVEQEFLSGIVYDGYPTVTRFLLQAYSKLVESLAGVRGDHFGSLGGGLGAAFFSPAFNAELRLVARARRGGPGNARAVA
jgi:hypothetical protein